MGWILAHVDYKGVMIVMAVIVLLGATLDLVWALLHISARARAEVFVFAYRDEAENKVKILAADKVISHREMLRTIKALPKAREKVEARLSKLFKRDTLEP